MKSSYGMMMTVIYISRCHICINAAMHVTADNWQLCRLSLGIKYKSCWHLKMASDKMRTRIKIDDRE